MAAVRVNHRGEKLAGFAAPHPIYYHVGCLPKGWVCSKAGGLWEAIIFPKEEPDFPKNYDAERAYGRFRCRRTGTEAYAVGWFHSDGEHFMKIQVAFQNETGWEAPGWESPKPGLSLADQGLYYWRLDDYEQKRSLRRPVNCGDS